MAALDGVAEARAFASDAALQHLLETTFFHKALVPEVALPQSPTTQDSNEARKGVSTSVDSPDFQRLLCRAIVAKKPSIVSTCFAHGAKALVKDACGRSALHYAATSGSAEIMRMVLRRIESHELSQDATPPRNNDENVPPMEASHTKLTQASQFYQAVNERDLREWTPLLIAVCRGYAQIVEALLETGEADITLLYPHSSSPCIRSGTHSRLIHFAAMHNDIDIFKLLVKHGADPADRDASGRQPLHYACARASLAFVTDMMQYLTSDQIDLPDSMGRTPLHVSARRGEVPGITQILLEKGAEASRADDNGITPADLAAASTTPDSIPAETKSATSKFLETDYQKLVFDILQRGLQEPDTEQLARCVSRLGGDVCLKLYSEVLMIEQKGGMKVATGERKKTPGGVFFHLLRRDVMDGKVRREDFEFIRAALRDKRYLDARRKPFQKRGTK